MLATLISRCESTNSPAVIAQGEDLGLAAADVALASTLRRRRDKPSAVSPDPNHGIPSHCSRVMRGVASAANLSALCGVPPDAAPYLIGSSFVSDLGIWPYVVVFLHFLSFFTFRYRRGSNRRRTEDDNVPAVQVEFGFNVRRGG